MAIISTLLILSLLMFVHELGHFILAKVNGVYVEEFSLGMGSKLWQTKKGDTYYTLRLLPIGAYVKMLGKKKRIIAPIRSLAKASVNGSPFFLPVLL